jgi:hypothetical protein
MQYLCIKGVVTSQGVKHAGDIVSELPEFEAHILVSQGKLVEQAEARAQIVARDPQIEHRDPVAVRRPGRPRKD